MARSSTAAESTSPRDCPRTRTTTKVRGPSVAIGTAPGRGDITLSEAIELVGRVREAAARGAREGLEALAADVPIPIARIAIRTCPELPATVEERIRDNRAQTVADTVMYRQALATAAEERGWSVAWYNRDRAFSDAAAALGVEDINAVLLAMGTASAPPGARLPRQLGVYLPPRRRSPAPASLQARRQRHHVRHHRQLQAGPHPSPLHPPQARLRRCSPRRLSMLRWNYPAPSVSKSMTISSRSKLGNCRVACWLCKNKPSSGVTALPMS